MIINENEYGAPWNDQFYDVTFYFTLELEGVEFTSEELDITLNKEKVKLANKDILDYNWYYKNVPEE